MRLRRDHGASTPVRASTRLLIVGWLVAVGAVGMSPGTTGTSRLPARPTARDVPTAPISRSPVRGVDPGSPLVWYAPNMGSIDFPGLFSQPGRWSTARERVDVLQFYGNNVAGPAFDIGGDNVLDTFVDVRAFKRLRRWGIAIALELGVIKPFECSSRPWADYADLTITNVERNRGRVRFVSMDEPLLGGQDVLDGRGCGFGARRAARVVASYVREVEAAHPGVLVGDVEPYPHYSVAELKGWIVELARAGASPAYFHLDVDIERVRVEGQDVAADLRRLRDFCERRGIPFGVILTSNWMESGTDRSYFESTLRWADVVSDGMGRPLHVVFQSWQGPAASGRHEVPINLPDGDPDVYSHTRLILEGLEVFG